MNALGNYTRWAPLGPGGDPQLSLQGVRGGLASLRSRRRQATRGLGEYIHWGPLGPGGDPAMSLQGARSLGALPPDQELPLRDKVAGVSIMDQQTYEALDEAIAKELDPNYTLMDRYNVLADELLNLESQIEGMEIDDVPGWNNKIENLLTEYRSLLKHLNSMLGKDRQTFVLRPLLWGVGALLAAAGVAWFVYERRL